MNNKGFTLIELIVTIALLAIISLISFVSVNKIIEKSKQDNCNTLVENIKNATKEYVSDNRYNKLFTARINEYQMSINASELVSNEYLPGDIINPYTKENINPSDILMTIYFNNNYTAQSVIITAPADLLEDCQINEISIEK